MSPDQGVLGALCQALGTHAHLGAAAGKAGDSCPPGCPLLPSPLWAAALVGSRPQQLRASLLPDSCFSACYLGSFTT